MRVFEAFSRDSGAEADEERDPDGEHRVAVERRPCPRREGRSREDRADESRVHGGAREDRSEQTRRETLEVRTAVLRLSAHFSAECRIRPN